MRAALNEKGAVVWLTGLSGSGKSTLAAALVAQLSAAGRAAVLLDGDVLRQDLNADLGFSPQDRAENVRRAGAVAALFARAGLIVVCAFISPSRAGREGARRVAGSASVPFYEVFVDAPLASCEARDPKGLYARARRGELAELTGVDAPYEPPEVPALHLRTDRQGVAACLTALWALLGNASEHLEQTRACPGMK